MGGDAIRSLALALRGIWWRRWSALAVWLVGVACAGIAALGPAYASGARDAVLQASLRTAPTDARGTGLSVAVAVDPTVTRAALADRVDEAFGDRDLDGFLGPGVSSQSGEKRLFSPTNPAVVAATTLTVYRDDVCAHVVLTAGDCVSDAEPLGVIITAETAASRHWRVGTRVAVGSTQSVKTVRVRGVYVPREPDGRYWFAGTHQYFGQVAKYASSPVPRTDAVLVPARFWIKVRPELGDDVHAYVDLPVVTARVHPTNEDAVQAAIDAATDRVQAPFNTNSGTPSVATGLPGVLVRSAAARRAVAFPVLIVGLQLVVLAWLVLYLVLAGSAESRSSEIVLGKLRGLRPRETVLHALLEPLLLVVLAIPAGAVLCDLALRVTGRTVLGADVQIELPAASWWAATAAGLGGVVASVLASAAVLRRSVVEQWRRTERRPGRTGRIADTVIVTLAVAAFVDLATTHDVRGNARFLPAAVPALLAVACALAAARVVPRVARAAIGPTRGSRRIAAFVAVRQIGRRSADGRVFVLLTVAVALLVFGFGGRTVFRDNQRERAQTEVGAARVVTIGGRAGVDASAVVARLDPDGHDAAAVYAGPLSSDSSAGRLRDERTTTTPLTLIVDPERFAAVAHWRRDFGTRARLADEIAPLRAVAPSPVRAAMTALHVTTQLSVHAGKPVELRAGLTDAAGDVLDVLLARVAPAGRPVRVDATVPTRGCGTGCLFRRLSLLPDPTDDRPFGADVAVSALDAVSVAGDRDLLPALRRTRWSSPDSTAAAQSAVQVQTSGPGLNLTFAPNFTPVDPHGFAAFSAVPTVVPGLATATQLPARTPGHRFDAVLGSGLSVPVGPTTVAVLPRAGNAGLVLPRAWLAAARPDGYAGFRPNQVWLSASAPADFPARLRRAGLPVRGVESASARADALAAQGPSYAIRMLLIGAVAAAVLAVAGSSASLLVAARRRLYELAAIRALGVRPARVLGTLLLEQVTIFLAAAVVGAASGLVGARIALTRLPEFGDRPAFPVLLLDPPVALCLLLTAGVVVVLVLAAAAGGAGLVRNASPVRLREAQP